MSTYFQKTVVLFLFLSQQLIAVGQSHYEKGWQALNDADVNRAIEEFLLAKKNKKDKEKALLCLSSLYDTSNKEEKAAQFFQEYFEMASDPYPSLYALWFDESVIGNTGKKKPHQFELLKKLEKDSRNRGKIDGGTLYRLLHHHTMSFDTETADKYAEKISYIEDWAFLGPFDNVMNSGYDKDLGVLANPELDATFVSKYGAEVSWFNPPLNSNDGYIFKDMYFLSSSSIIYGQAFIEAPETKDYLLKLGYSGSLKVWINDALIHQEPEHRVTEMDYFRYQVKLNKGYNRILVQLGDYDESFSNFNVRFSSLDHTPILFPQTTVPQPYTKSNQQATLIPYFATTAFQSAIDKTNDPLDKILLAKAYMRSRELEKTEQLLLDLFKETPKNYFVLRNLILLYSKSGNTTNQNKYYELFEESYPQDCDILRNEITRFQEEENKEKVRELIGVFKEKYPDKYSDIQYDIVLAGLDNDNEKVLSLTNDFYEAYPDDYQAMVSKYRITKNYHSRPKEANKLLEDFLGTGYNYTVLKELASNYFSEGRIDEAMDLLRQSVNVAKYDLDVPMTIINILSRQSNYKEAIEMCEAIVSNNPSHYQTLQDLALLHTYTNDKKTALQYYEDALQYYPFSFEVNERIRELKEQKPVLELVPSVDPIAKIQEYESSFSPSIKREYDIVYYTKSLILFESKAVGEKQEYILRMNDEGAIEDWQNVDLSTSRDRTLIINESKTIKQNGSKIEAERNGDQVVFTNLEIGDYIYISYTEKQFAGGKSSVYISDQFALNSYNPTYQRGYHVFVEDGLTIRDTTINIDLNPTITKEAGFTHFSWTQEAPLVLKEETFMVPFNDMAQYVHISLDYDWDDIVQWYSDLSTFQAKPDYTIKQLSKELFEGKQLSDSEKAKVIYDFVSKNIQYSSIDFRQSSYIPQKASEIYHSRLGDCKDVSTLFVSLARESGLEANLVLINTSNNGQKNVLLPSLNFNHCIVKVNLEDNAQYLELTDPNLPYGHLYHYHHNAAILDIPYGTKNKNNQLAQLKMNKAYQASVVRKAQVQITPDNEMKIEQQIVRKGTQASSACDGYYNLDEEERKKSFKQGVSRHFKSPLKLSSLVFEKLEPRLDEAVYTANYTVSGDVLKLGSFRAVKVPFTDFLMEMSLFEEGTRTQVFDFVYYENTDEYKDVMDISIDSQYEFIEIPNNIELEFQGNRYTLVFEKRSPQQLTVRRTYTVNRTNIEPEDFEDFKVFMTQINEAENSHLLYR